MDSPVDAIMDESNESASSENSKGAGDDVCFDFYSFCKNMKKCIAENVTDADDVELGNYLKSYEELYNFFLLLGGAFQFVSVDVKNKIKILYEFRNEEMQKSNKVINFTTVKTMVDYEKSGNMFQNRKYVSGSRTLLRLHRGLDFIRRFLAEVYKAANEAKLGGIAKEVYDKTLADYHSWVVRNAARMAMQFLPIRSDLLRKICRNDEEKIRTMLEDFPDALEVVNSVYNRVQTIYENNDLLDLP